MKVGATISLPGDKSMSHRAAIFASLAAGRSTITNFLTAEDTLNTLKAFKQAGVRVERDGTDVTVESNGLKKLQAPAAELDVGNSGTGARLLLGLFSGLKGFTATITGDESLRSRDMRRITVPLTELGASFSTGDKLPITVNGAALAAFDWQEVLGSAQVKSALLLAALASGCPAEITQHKPSRDHTENIMQWLGIELTTNKKHITLAGNQVVPPAEYVVPGDISSAAFFVVLGLLAKAGELVISNVLLNPYRDKYIDVLKAMGANIEVKPTGTCSGEKTGDLVVRPSRLQGIKIDSAEVPSLIDELPILTIAGLFSEGTFSFRGAEELRKKESDRIHAMCFNLKNLGVEVNEFEDGLSLAGNPGYRLEGAVEVFHDHRIAMSFEIAGLRAKQNTPESAVEVAGKEWVNTSFPQFYDILNRVVSL